MEVWNCSIEDKALLTSCLEKQHRSLEYDSGDSTPQIASLIHSLVRIAHLEPWYDRVHQAKTHNTTLFFRRPDLPHQIPYDDTYEQFESDITAPIGFPPFDFIMIDGRERYYSAEFEVEHLNHEDTIIFIADFSLDPNLMHREYRLGYLGVLDFLQVVDNQDRLIKFRIK